MPEPLSRFEYQTIDFSDPDELLSYAKKLEGHSFREVLDLGIRPKDGKTEAGYNDASFKGGVGSLIEERYFGYRANDNPVADFEEAGVELKTTCYDRKANGDIRAGERLVLGMIGFDESIEADLFESHMWEKGGRILLIYYGRDRGIDKYDQRISYVMLFTPSEEDMRIIEEDYRLIQRYVVEGRADELSESLTRYLGACTKGATRDKSMRDQAVYAPGKMARSRAWCYKSSYMNAVLHERILGMRAGESIVKDSGALEKQGFEEYVLSLMRPFVGKSDKEICDVLGLPYTKNKAQWTSITCHMLGLSGDRAEEFERANINARTVRVGQKGSIKESLSLDTLSFLDLVQESWEDAPLHRYFEETRFFFVVFHAHDDGYVLKGARFWSMPSADIDGPLYECWHKVAELVRRGIRFVKTTQKSGKTIIKNDLPGASDNPVAHVRPHAGHAAYRLADGTEIGNVERDGAELPDGQWMTKQSFWLNTRYVYDIVKDL